MTERYGVAMVAACPFPCGRGTPTRVFRMAEALAQRGHRVHVVTYHHGEPVGPTPFQIHRTPQLRTYRRLAPGPSCQKLLIVDPLLALRLSSVLGRHRIDVIHAHHYEALIIALLVARWTTHPIVYDAHTLLGQELPFYSLALPRAVKRRLGDLCDRTLPRRAAHIIAVTEEIAQALSQRDAPSQGISVISNGVELDLFERASDLPPPPGGQPKLLIFTGNLAAYQGIDLLLASFRQVAQAREDVRLLIVTESPFTAYEALARELGVRDRIEVVQAGFDAVPGLLARADIALSPRPTCPGVPQKLLNYMAAGKPIVAFAGSAKGLRHGELGWVVQNGDVGAFARAILRLLEDPALAGRFGADARRYVRAERSWSSVAARVEEVYQGLLPRWAAQGGAGREAVRARPGA